MDRESATAPVERLAERLDVFDVLILAVLAGMIVLSPLAMGAVAPWAKNGVFVLCLAVGLLWVLQAARRGRVAVVRDPVLIFVGLFFLVVAFQLVPFAPSALEKIAPETAGVYQNTLEGYPQTGEARTISLNPYHTGRELERLAGFFLIFLVIAGTFRTRVQVVTLILAMLAVAVFEALYGFSDFMAGGKRIFWNERVIAGHRVSGTFVNCNNFAGLLEMIVPVTLGLLMVAAPRRFDAASFKTKVVETISSGTLQRRILLGIAAVLMTMGVFFSLSRAGISAVVGGVVLFFLMLKGRATGSQRFALTVVVLIVAFLCAFFSSDWGVVVDRIEQSISSETISGEGRLDIWRSCGAMISDFRWFGTGLGTFGETFERFQSSLFGDKDAAFAHNDWLQVLCETGILGGIAAIGGILLLFVRLSRRTLDRRDTFCRAIAAGALGGCAAMLIHSFFDFNLSKVTSNALVFAAIFGLWYAAVHMQGSREGSRSRLRTAEVPLGPKPVRLLVALAALAGAGLLAAQPLRSAAADIHFNTYLALADKNLEQPRLYHFLPVEVPTDPVVARAEAGQALGRARKLDPRNPLYLFYDGVEKAHAAYAPIRKEAWASAREIAALDLEAAGDDAGQGLPILEEAVFRAYLEDPAAPAPDQAALAAAEQAVREAIRQAPSASMYHLFLADLILERAAAKPVLSSAEAAHAHAVAAALYLAPNKPRTHFHAGKIALLAALANGSRGTAPDFSALEQAFNAFRHCIALGSSIYTQRIYALIDDSLGDSQSFTAVTPDTIDDYEQLIGFLRRSQAWDAVVAALDKMERLSSTPGLIVNQPGSEEPNVQAWILERRAEALRELGQLDNAR